MFGDFFNQFGLDQFLQSMRQAQQQQVPFAPGQVDAQGGVFGQPGEAPAGSLHELGLGGGGPAGGRGGGALTAGAVAQGPSMPAAGGGASPLQLGGSSPMAPGGRQALEGGGKGPLEQGADNAFKSAAGEMDALRNSIFKAFGISGR